MIYMPSAPRLMSPHSQKLYKPRTSHADIGCGMYSVNLGKVEIDFEKLDEAAHFVPSGMHVWEGRMERFDLTGLKCYRGLSTASALPEFPFFFRLPYILQ